jgi:hypothetical protein
MVFNMNGLLQQAGSAQVLNVAEGACADTTQYLQLGCTCAAGTITQDTCDSPIEWCRNCTKVSTRRQPACCRTPWQHVESLGGCCILPTASRLSCAHTSLPVAY